MDDTALLIQAERKANVLDVVSENMDEFDSRFPYWLEQNWPIWVRFEWWALHIAQSREHFGAAAIWERIRFDTLLAEKDRQWKLNNNFCADCTRLFALVHPRHSNFFSTRRRRSLAQQEIEA